MKRILIILLFLFLSSCGTYQLSHQLEYNAITSMNDKGQLAMISVNDLTYSYPSMEYYDWYFYYNEQWHLGRDWFNSLDYPFRTEKQQKRFIKKYNKKINNPKFLMLIKH